MAKVGLNFGDKMEIGGKSYRVIDGLQLEDALGKTTFRTIEGPDVIYEDDLTQPRRQDGTYPQVTKGEVRGTIMGIHSSAQHETIFVTVVDTPLSTIEGLGLNFRDEVVLEGVVVTYSSVNGNSNYKIFASSIAKKGQAQSKPKEQAEHKDNK